MYKIADGKLKLEGVESMLDTNCPNDLHINFDVIDRIVITINNKTIEVDKDKLAGSIILFLSKEDMFEDD